jgi:hypothetical protein
MLTDKNIFLIFRVQKITDYKTQIKNVRKQLTKKRKRILFLLGAGAAYHWFDKSKISASTDDITKEMETQIPFCKLLREQLSEMKLPSVNFETLVNSIENLTLHYYGLKEPIDYDNSLLFEPSGWVKDYFKTENNESIKNQLFDIYEKCIEIIVDKIKSYDCCIKDNYEGKNNSLKEFLLFMKNSSNVLRAYTLNYDQMFIDVCKDSTLEFNDGFEKTSDLVNPKIGGSNDFIHKFSIDLIINKIDNDCFYNLHGSVFWHWLHYPFGSTEKSQFVKTFEYFGGFSDWESINTGDNLKESNPNERIIKAPIITGFKKLQRLNIEPFNAISNTFYRDCLQADAFVFIGYSFNDPHINNVLSNSHIAEKNVIVVDYNPQKELKNHGLQSIIGEDFEDVIKNGINKRENIRYYNDGISDFLKDEHYRTLLNFF